MTDSASSTKQEFNRIYSDVAASIATATAEIDKLEIDHKSGKQEIGSILERLRLMQARFDDELSLLEEHAEWEKFTIAFFGETNAGKSTIIESLRILFNEESRQQLLEQNACDLMRYKEELDRHLETVRRGFAQAHAAYVTDIATVRRDIDTKAGAMLDTSTARTATIKLELTTLERALQAETSARGKLENALATARRNTWVAAVAGCVLGGAVVGIILLALN